FYLSPAREGERYRLAARQPKDGAFVPQTVDFADRADIDHVFLGGGGIVDQHLDRLNALVFVSEPLAKPIELSGLCSGRLDFTANKKDLDFGIDLYELTAQGEYMALSSSLSRASYIQDRGRRQLLAPNRRQRLDFTNGRLTSRRFQSGSR